MSSRTPQRGTRHTIARHGRLRTPSPIGNLLKITGIAVSAVLVAGLGVAAFIVGDLTQTYTADAVDIGGDAPPPDIGELTGGVNILVAGTDTCEPEYAQYFGERCAEGAEEGVRSDVNMVLHISDEPRRVTVVSFPRDLIVEVPACTDANGAETWPQDRAMLNSAYDAGGLSCTVSTIENLTGMDIQYAASVNWGGVMQITDAVGGVEVCLAQPIRDEHTQIDWAAGNRTIQGLEALQFLRTRYGVGDGSDLGRISNQQQYMSRLVNKLMSEEVLTNPVTLLKLAKTGLGAVDPSTSLTNPTTLVQIALAVKDVPFSDFAFVAYPTTYDAWDPNRVLPDTEAADTLFAALAANEPFAITGEAGAGVVTEEEAAAAHQAAEQLPEGAEPAPPVEAAPTEESVAPDASATAAAGPVQLSENIKGTTAADFTCSAGNG